MHEDDAGGIAQEEADGSDRAQDDDSGAMSAIVCVCGQGVKVARILQTARGDSCGSAGAAASSSAMASSSSMRSACLGFGRATGLALPSSIFQVCAVVLPGVNRAKQGGGGGPSAAGRAVDSIVVAASLTGAGTSTIPSGYHHIRHISLSQARISCVYVCIYVWYLYICLVWYTYVCMVIRVWGEVIRAWGEDTCLLDGANRTLNESLMHGQLTLKLLPVLIVMQWLVLTSLSEKPRVAKQQSKQMVTPRGREIGSRL